MYDTGLTRQLTSVRIHAERLVTQLGADPALTTPFFQAITAFEQHLLASMSLAERVLGENASAIGEHRLSTIPRPADDQIAGSAERQNNLSLALSQAEAQRAQFQQVLQDVPTGICILHGPEHIYTFTNPVYEQFVGRSDMLGKTVRELFPEIAGQGIYELLDEVYTTGTPFITREILIQFDRRGDGVREDVYFDLTYRPLREADGTITDVVAYVLDISDRRALEEQRAQVLQLTQAAQHTAEVERQRLLEILRQAPSAICTVEGPEHVFTFTNPRYDQFVGRQDVVGKAVRTALPEVEGQGFFELLDQVYATGEPFIGNEVPIQLDLHDTGTLEQAFVNFIYAPLRDASERVSGIFVQAVDVTELVTARQRAEEAVLIRDQFLSIAAHELKTPLTSLLGSMQVIQRRLRRSGEMDERTDRSLTMIGAQGQRLNRLIDTLLNVARINQGHLSLNCGPLDLGTLTTQVVDELSITLHQQVIQVTTPPQPCLILGDGLRLEQVIVNLLQNAVKYSPAGGTIQVTVESTASEGCVTIRDEGIGIPAAALPHLFDRFYRVAEGAAQSIPGMGIGLFVVHDIVTLHGGTISVESSEGKGSMFTVCLPLIEASESVQTT